MKLTIKQEPNIKGGYLTVVATVSKQEIEKIKCKNCKKNYETKDWAYLCMNCKKTCCFSCHKEIGSDPKRVVWCSHGTDTEKKLIQFDLLEDKNDN